jgi:hypothetical protein
MAMNLEYDAEALQETGMTTEEWLESQYPEDADVLLSGRFPLLASVGEEPDMDLDLDTLFEFGLRVLLNGIEALVEGRS